jgi:hypothetical protein
MKNDSLFYNSTWANGQPSIDIDPYDNSLDGFDYIIKILKPQYSFENSPIENQTDSISSTIKIKDENVEIIFDEWSCSLAFETVELRDEVLEYLQKL